MAKKLVSQYTFTPGTSGVGTIVLPGVVPLKAIQLITNVTDNLIIYNFAATGSGGTAVVDHENQETTLTLDFDTSAMNAADELQVFIDKEFQNVDFNEAYVDPVNKLRVSTPSNLIDTDFEYGLQPSKWETLEVVNSIPAFYPSQSNITVTDILSVTSVANSDVITCTTANTHGLTVGTPVDVRGLSSYTAEGKYLVSKVPTTTTFAYNARTVQSATATLNGAYTSIVPGEFYTASDINFNKTTGITTDNATPSTLTVNTDYNHGLTADTQIYLRNTIGQKVNTLQGTLTDNAADGRPIIDHENILNNNVSFTPTLTEAKEKTGIYSFKIQAADVDISTNKILWTNNSLAIGDALLYIPPAGDTEIGGLQRFQIYYVKSVDSAGITLCETTGGTYATNAAINFTSAGTYDFGRGQFQLVYEVKELQREPSAATVCIQYKKKKCKAYGTRYSSTTKTIIRTRAKVDNTTTEGSGRDLMSAGQSNASNTGNSGYWGVSELQADRFVLAKKSAGLPATNVWDGLIYNSTYDANFTFGKSGTLPDGYEFVEDFSRYENGGGNYTGAGGTNLMTASTAGELVVDSVSSGSYTNVVPATGDPAFTETYSDGDVFICPLMADTEADTMFLPGHNLSYGTSISIALDSGNPIQTQAEAATATEVPSFTTQTHPLTVTGEVMSPDRIKLQIGGTNQRIRVADGAYTATYTDENATANSIYIQNHGLVSGESVSFSAGTNGVLPTLSTNAPTPTPNGAIAEAIFRATEEALDDIRTTMGADAANLLINGTNAVTPFNGTASTVTDGTMTLSHTMNSVTVQHKVTSGGSLVTSYTTTENFPTTNNNWSQGVAYNYMSGTPFGGYAYNVVQTKFEQNQERPYWITVFEVPDPSKIPNIESISVNDQTVSYLASALSTTETSNVNDFSASTPVLTNGWRYTHDGVFSPPSTSANQQHGLFSVALIVDNTTYAGHSTDSTETISFGTLQGNSTNRSASFIGASGSRYLIQLLLPVKSGADPAGTEYGLTSGSITHVDDIAEKIAFKIRDNVIAATYTPSLTNALVKVVDGDRVSLQNTNGIIFDFTSSGTAPINVNLGTSIGALDGTQIVSSVTANSFSLASSSAIPPRNLEVPGTAISNISTRCIFNYSDHSLDFEQAIVFSDPAVAFSGLTDGATYYAIPLDKDNFEIATTVDNALNSIGVTVTAPISGNYSFSVSSVTGLTPAAGLVTTELGSIVVNGNDEALFKQYYKPGDIIYIVNDGTTPGRVSQFTISSIPENNKLNLTTAADFTSTDTNYLVRTAAYVRPDGTFIHRPFDGGVEITAGTSPNSKIIRQTRKYFRYQSGKGLQCSIAINFNPARSIELITGDTTNQEFTIYTTYPHGLTQGDTFLLRGITSTGFNGQYQVATFDDFSFTASAIVSINTSLPTGIGEWAPVEWQGASVRCGMFDDQNGFFYEFDGQVLKACRRDSVTQISGNASVSNGSNIVTGLNTSFTQQLTSGDNIVIRGQSYKVTAVESPTAIHIQPTYRGSSQQRVIIAKTIDYKVPQSNWNLDTADGNGPSGFKVDPTKIQMVYMDYSWYGAGKIRFGFKDTVGKVRYMHQFVHNNELNEAYMRSGNLPGRYEIENVGTPTYVPTLFHWGTSIIMDGGFDDDKAYLFTAPSNSLQFTNGIGNITATTVGASTLIDRKSIFYKSKDFYVRIPFDIADAAKFSTGVLLFGTGLDAAGEQVAFTDYANGNFNAYIFVTTSRYTPSPGSYSSVASGTSVSIGAPSGGSNEDLELLVDLVPIVSIRLAPSVDNNLTGAVGDRDIINRMQLQLRQLGLNTTHNVEIELVLNGSLSSIDYEKVQSPSLSQLIKHVKGDTIVGGTPVFSLRASGGQVDSTGKRNSEAVDFDLSKITDLGNSILGGDNVFPNGPDLITIAARIVDTAEVTGDAPFKIAGRLTWTESQA